MATNCTLRGDFLTHRPPYSKLIIDYNADFDGLGLFQGAAYYQPDYGDESILALVSGRLYQFFPGPNSVQIEDVTRSVDPIMSTTLPMCWMWQAEKWMIIQNGTDIPHFYSYDKGVQKGAVRQDYATASLANTVPPPGDLLILTVDPASEFPGFPDNHIHEQVTLNDPATGAFLGEYTVQPISSTQAQASLAFITDYDYGSTSVSFVDTTQLQTPTPWATIFLEDVDARVIGKHEFEIAGPYLGNKGDRINFKYRDAVGHTFSVTNSRYAYVSDFRTDSTTGANYVTLTPFQQANGGPAHDFIQPAKIGTQYVSWIYPNIDWIVTKGVGAYKSVPTWSTVTSLVGLSTVPGTVSITPPWAGTEPITVWISGKPFTMTAIVVDPTLHHVFLLNLTGNEGTSVPIGSVVRSIPQLPIGRMGCYVLGRNWMALADGLSYIASDMVGNSSGSPPEFRDAVLRVTQNDILAGGGAFRVPGNCGDIRFIADMESLDMSLGQGPVQIGTPRKIFSCNAPYLTSIDRSNWQLTTNPIVTESMVGKGGQGQHAALAVDGDLWFRSNDGLRSLMLGRKNFNLKRGNTSQSLEVDPILELDPEPLLPFCSQVYFDNRQLFSTGLSNSPSGVYGSQAAVINRDAISSMADVATPIYDGIWQDLNVLRYVKGEFAGTERCFAFALNDSTRRIELWEIRTSPSDRAPRPLPPEDYLDNSNSRITWSAETPILMDTLQGKQHDDLARLVDGELYVSDIQGQIDFAVYFRPDYDLNWHLWRSWTVPDGVPYEPRMGIGEPPNTCGPKTKRPWREGYSFQIKIVVTGHCVIMGGRLSAVVLPTPAFAPPAFAPAQRPLPTTPVRPFVPFRPSNVPAGAGLIGAGGQVIIGAGGEPVQPVE